MALEQAKRADVDSMLLLRGEAQTCLSFLTALVQLSIPKIDVCAPVVVQ